MIGRQRRGSPNAVCFLDAKSRMSQPQRERAVVSEQQEAFAISIQPADGIEAATVFREKISERAASLRVATRAQDVAGLVEQEVDASFRLRPAAIHQHNIATWPDRHALLGDRMAVDGDPPFRDDFLAGSAGSQAATGKVLMKPERVTPAWFLAVRNHGRRLSICHVCAANQRARTASGHFVSAPSYWRT